MLTSTEGLILVFVYGIAMVAVVLFVRRRKSSDDFLVMNRELGTWRGAFSIAVSWIWAPAVFICSLQAFTQGLPGIFWFTFPNILCFFIFAPIAVRARKLFPSGYTMPDFINARYSGDKKVHIASLFVYFGYQLGAIIINCAAGAALLHILTGIAYSVAVLIMSATALAYSLISGLRASVITDVIQMSLILVIGFFIVPWVISEAGGVSVLSEGLGGQTGEFRDLFNPYVAYAFGIATSLGLISGPIADQMFFQRAFAVKRGSIVRVFVYGGLIFGVVPIVLSLLGFVGAAPSVQAVVTVDDPQMVGPIVVGHFLPKWALMLFTTMAFAGLTSTLDSALCAVSSLGGIDVFKRYFSPEASDSELLKMSRLFMIIMAFIGTSVALLQPQLLWVFLIYGALASAALFPTVLSIFWSRLPAQGAFWAIVLSLVVATPLSIYANVNGDVDLIVLAAVISVLIGLVVCLFFGLRSSERFDFSSLSHTAEATE